MSTSVLFTRHGVRNVPDKVPLADGTLVPFQSFSIQKLPLYASPTNNEVDGNLCGVGWDFSEKLGKFLRKKYKNIEIRASVSTNRTIDTGIALARSAGIEEIIVYNGPIDPLFFPREFYGYKLPPGSLAARQGRYDQSLNDVKKISEAITKAFGVPLPIETTITLDATPGLLGIEERFSQEPTFSSLCGIDLGITKHNAKKITQGITIRQFVDNIPPFIQQQSSNMAQYILNTLLKKEDKLTVLVGNDSPISSLAALLEYEFQIPGLAVQYVNANSGLLFTLEKDHVRVEFLGIDLDGKFQTTRVARPIRLSEFQSFIEGKINPEFLNLSDINNVSRRRVL